MSYLKLDKIEKTYVNGFKAVHGVSISIEKGDFLVLVGPSGCAKSTILRMIAGLEDITGGELSIDGKVVNDVLPKDRDIAMVFQDYALYPHMSVYENIAYGLKLKGVSSEIIESEINKVAENLELSTLLKRKPKELSGGQRQRVALARALVKNPKVFLLDEPLSNLDAKLRISTRAKISEIQSDLNATMVYVTHDQVEAMTMGNKVCVLRAGRIMQLGAPLDLYNYPQNKFVATFIGSPGMNLIDGIIEQDGFEICFRAQDIRIPLPENKASQVKDYVGKSVAFGIRTSDLLLEDEPENKRQRFEGKVVLIEKTGSQAFVHIKAFNTTLIARVRVVNIPHIKIGLVISFWPNLAYCHIFDNETENNITLGA